VIGSLRCSGTITIVSLRLSYLIFRQVLGLILLLGRSSSTNADFRGQVCSLIGASFVQ